jgi:hypothetical protein
VISLPTLCPRFYEFSWYFFDFIWFTIWHQSSRLKLLLASTTQPRRLMSTSCLPCTASRWVRICTASDHQHSHSIECTRSCNVPASLSRFIQHRLVTVSKSTSHVWI